MPGGKTVSVAALTATLATEVTFTGGVKKGPTSGTWLSGFACFRTCIGKKNMATYDQGTYDLLIAGILKVSVKEA